MHLLEGGWGLGGRDGGVGAYGIPETGEEAGMGPHTRVITPKGVLLQRRQSDQDNGVTKKSTLMITEGPYILLKKIIFIMNMRIE